jgi:hypothetical protein
MQLGNVLLKHLLLRLVHQGICPVAKGARIIQEKIMTKLMVIHFVKIQSNLLSLFHKYQEIRSCVYMKNFLQFAYLQALSCLFPLIIFAALALTKFEHIPFLPRYDFILLICLGAQIFSLSFPRHRFSTRTI